AILSSGLERSDRDTQVVLGEWTAEGVAGSLAGRRAVLEADRDVALWHGLAALVHRRPGLALDGLEGEMRTAGRIGDGEVEAITPTRGLECERGHVGQPADDGHLL